MVTLYLDVLFVINFIMDLCLLWVVGLILRTKIRYVRLILGAFIGSIWVCIISLINLPDGVENVLSLLVVSSLMIRLSFSPKNLRTFLKAMCLLYVTAFLLGGLINTVYYHTGLGSSFRQWVWGEIDMPVSWKLVMGSAVVAAVLIRAGIYWYRHYGKQELILDVILTYKSKSMRLKGLYDTGNCLFEPVTGRSVHIMEFETARCLLSQEEQDLIIPFLELGSSQMCTPKPQTSGSYTSGDDLSPSDNFPEMEAAAASEQERAEPDTNPGFYLIPYRSVGKESGLLPALCMTSLVTNEEMYAAWSRPIIGFCDHELDGQKRYHIIIHPGEES